jgi:hypothetical protein
MSSSLQQKYEVTQKVVLAQQQYIKDLEAKIQNASGQIASSTQIQQLQRGINHFRNVVSATEQENRRLQQELNDKNAELSTSNIPQMSSMTKKVQQEYARKLEIAKNDLSQLEKVVARNQKLAESAHQVLEEERNHRERLIEEQVSDRVKSILSNTNESAKLEVAALKAEVSRLKSSSLNRNDSASNLRDELVNDVQRLRKQLNRQSRVHDDHVSKLHDQLVQTVRVMEEREIIIAEERQAYESELALCQEVSEQKIDALMNQIDELNSHSEALTTTLAKQPLLYTDEDGNLDPTEEKPARQVQQEYEEKIRDLLKLKEKNEAKVLAERQQLLESIEEEDMKRTERERLKDADTSARIKQKDSMLKLWEQREQVLLEEVDSLKSKMEQVIELSTARENNLSLQVKSLSTNTTTANDIPLNIKSKREADILNNELEKLKNDFMNYRNEYNENSIDNIKEQTIELQNVLNLAKEQLTEARSDNKSNIIVPMDEYRALKNELNVLRCNALERDTSISMIIEKKLKIEHDLRCTIRESVDALENEKIKNENNSKEYNNTLRELRNYIKQADDAHSKSEEISSNELIRLRKETDTLHNSIKDQRKHYEDVIIKQENIMREHVSFLKFFFFFFFLLLVTNFPTNFPINYTID